MHDSSYSLSICPPNVHRCAVHFQHVLWIILVRRAVSEPTYYTLPHPPPLRFLSLSLDGSQAQLCWNATSVVAPRGSDTVTWHTPAVAPKAPAHLEHVPLLLAAHQEAALTLPLLGDQVHWSGERCGCSPARSPSPKHSSWPHVSNTGKCVWCN